MKNVKTGHPKPIVCLDAGHYGKYNRSPAVPAYYESEMNWKLHLMLKEELEKCGIQIKTTRADQGKDMDVVARGKASKDCDLFVSLHSNAVGNAANESVDYVAAYHLTDDSTTTIDEQSKELAKNLAPVIKDIMGVKQASNVISRKAGSDRNGDGIMNDNYYGVLHGARVVGTPGVILEHSFHTNTRSTKWLMEDSNLRKLAVAEAKVIAEWFDVAKAEEPKRKTVTVTLPVIYPYDKGEHVEVMQALLIGYGYSCGPEGVDGSCGGATQKALMQYQSDSELEADCKCGPATWGSLLRQK